MHFVIGGMLALALSPANCATTEAARQGGGVPSLAYKASSGGLKDQVEDILEAIETKRTDVVNNHVKQMVLPEGSDWFTRVFGAQGDAMAKLYQESRYRYAASLESDMKRAFESKMTRVEVLHFEESCSSDASEDEYPVLAARVTEEPLYMVRFWRGNVYNVLRFFAFVDGAFRYVDFPRIASTIGRRAALGNAPSEPPPGRIRVAGSVQQAALIHSEAPSFPERAKRRGLQGTVRLSALIATDGSLREIQVIRGHCWLAQPAVDAVKKWKYRPTLLQGKPVEVVTTVDVVFTLSMR